MEEDLKDMRIANATSIFKKGKSEDLEYDRSVSLTLFSKKEIEKISPETVFRYMKVKKIIERSQHGFRKSKCGQSDRLFMIR